MPDRGGFEGGPGLPLGPPAGEPINARPWRAPHPPARVLAIRIQALGDTVATLPYLSALARKVPGCEIDVLTRADYAGLARGVRLARHVFVLRGMSRASQTISAASLMPRLWARRYDVVLDLQRNPVSRMVRRLIAARAWSEYDRFSPMLAGERYRATIESIGLGSLDVLPDLTLVDPDGGLVKLRGAGWDPDSELVILNPGGLVGDRNWPTARYVALARRLAEWRAKSVTFVVLGIPKIAATAAEIRTALGPVAIDLVGRTSLPEAMAIVQRADLVISEDGGLLHMAWALGTRTVGLFGASRPVWARPHGNYSRLVSACPEDDGTCMDGRCRRGPPSCLAGLPVERVLASALDAFREPVGGKAIARNGMPILSELVEPAGEGRHP